MESGPQGCAWKRTLEELDAGPAVIPRCDGESSKHSRQCRERDQETARAQHLMPRKGGGVLVRLQQQGNSQQNDHGACKQQRCGPKTASLQVRPRRPVEAAAGVDTQQDTGENDDEFQEFQSAPLTRSRLCSQPLNMSARFSLLPWLTVAMC